MATPRLSGQTPTRTQSFFQESSADSGPRATRWRHDRKAPEAHIERPALFSWRLRSSRACVYSRLIMRKVKSAFLIRAIGLVWFCLLGATAAPQSGTGPYAVRFADVAQTAGLSHRTIYGDEHKNKYLLETTGCGVAWFDYDNDGWLDLFFVNGTRLNTPTKPDAPTTRLYRNNRNGTFTDVTKTAGLGRTGWGQAVCIGDIDQDGFDDLFISYYGRNALYKNNGNGSFADVSLKAGVAGDKTRWGSGAAFVDYDKDGDLDLFVANYIDLDLKTAPTPETGPCLYKGLMVACGPPGLTGGKNILYQNNGKGGFTNVSEKAGILKTYGTYGLGVIVADFDS